MGDPVFLHRLQFAFTIVYHYLFPVLTMGLAFLIFVMKALGLRRGGERWNDAARFWIRIFGINFAVGVVTGIPMEFQFGANWARFSRYAGNVVGHTLAMEGLFAFFLESSFLSLLVWGEKRLSRVGHFLAATALFAGSWLSGYFITATNAFMQHPAGHAIGPNGDLVLADFWGFLLNPWAVAQYAHNMVSTVVTASFVVAALGSFYLLQGKHVAPARLFLRLGVTAGLVSSVLVAFPTGDRQAKLVAQHQPVALAAMEGRFESGSRASLNLIGQPNVRERRLENPIAVPDMLSFLAYGHFYSDVRGLDEFPQKDWPDNDRAPVLRLPHHGGAGDDPDRHHGAGCGAPVDGKARKDLAHALGPHALVPIPLHRGDRGLDDGGARPAAVARLRALPDGAGLQPDCALGHGALHAHRLLRPLHGPLGALRVPHGPRDRPRTGGGRGACLTSGTRSQS